jgi:hypothetical protein
VIADLSVTVTEAGATRTATLVCQPKQNLSSGYLTPAWARSTACVGVVVNADNADFLRSGLRPAVPDKCAETGGPHVGAHAEIDGRFEDKPVHRVVRVQTACDEVLWEQLRPLLEPTRDVVLPSNPD